MNTKIIDAISFTILIFLGIYTFLVFKNSNEYVNVVSISIGVITCVMLFFSYNNTEDRKKKSLTCVILYFIFWTLLDINSYLSLTSKAIFSYKMAMSIYVASTVFVVLPCVFLIFENISIINKKQLIVDCVALLVGAHFTSNLFLDILVNRYNLEVGSGSPLFIMLVVDLIIIMFLFFILSIFRLKNFYKSTFFEILAFVIVFINNLLKIYYADTALPIWIKMLYVCPFLMIVVSTFVSKNKYELEQNKIMNFVNTGNSSFITLFFLLIIIAQLFLYEKEKIDIHYIMAVFLSVIIYLMISLKYQNYLLARSLTTTHEIESEDLKNDIYKRNSELEKANASLTDSVRRDILTGLFSRKYLMEILEGYDTAYIKKDVTIFVIDIVKFRAINELTGHKTGDYVLIEIANSLRNMFKEHMVFRADSNEFVVLLEGEVYTNDSIRYKAKDITNVLTLPLLIDNYSINPEIVIGCDKYNSATIMFSEVFRNAENSCFEAKNNYNGQDNFVLYNEILANKINRKAKIEALLESINYNEEFIMYYQPQFSVDGKKLIGMESLLRWNSKAFGGMISPSEFIPIAENSNTIIRIVKWTFDKATAQIKAWNTKYNTNLKMAINISPKYLSSTDFLKEVEEHIEKEGLKTSWLDFEITEMSAMTVGHNIVNLFEELHDMGVSVSVDDFGTGYSSLSYIKSFKIDKLKIAKELIDNIATDKNEYMIVKSIIMMAQGLNIKTIAEGVEQVEQRDRLQELSCNQIQGYYYGKPTTAHNFEKLYIENRVF